MTILFSTEAEFVTASIPVGDSDIRTAGYFTPGDGGGHVKKRISTPSPVKPWHKQSGDGAWWELAENAVTPQMFGAAGDYDYSANTGADDTDAIRAAVAYGRKVYVPYGLYRVTGEIEITKAGQVIEFENAGGYGYGSNNGNFENNTAIVATGTFAKRVRTRRLHRANAGAAKDAALSVVLNVQAEGVHLIRPAVRLYCDYSNASPSNLGDNCDVGIFLGTRVGVQIHAPIVIDYFRWAGILVDVTNGGGLPRFPSLAGPAYPTGTVINGSDGTHIWNPHIKGPRKGLAALGARPAAGNTGYGPNYFDDVLGSAVADTRGSFGCSDFNVYGGRIYGPDHHSNRRLADPASGGLTLAKLKAEPDSMPAALHIDGLAGNSSGSIWGMNFWGTRFATFEAFRVRLDYCSRVRFYGCHIEGRDGGRMSTAGAAISTNDYANTTYGDISGTDNTGRVLAYGTDAQQLADGFNHFYGESLRVTTDSGREFIPGYIESTSGEIDIRAKAGSGIRFRSGTNTIATISSSGDLSVTGSIGGGSGGSDTVLPVFTAANIASKTHAVNTTGKVQGKLVWDSTNFRIMVAAGGANTSTWRVADGSAAVAPV